ncbi:MAG: SDR family oxidoreductase, partial [Acidobacteriaceae bacterium]|nr:SDR family oxidoreductase [Acidobacteriaceae bacterium]
GPVLVTGSGGTGCGRAIAIRFAREFPVIVCDINETGGHETVRLIEAIGGRAVFHKADVADEALTRALMEFTESEFGGLSVLVNNASAPAPSGEGIGGWGPPLQTDLFGTLNATRYAIEVMRRHGGGSIVNMASISALWNGRKTPGGFSGYDVAKAAVIRLTTVLGRELAADGIRINCLAPGWIATDGPRQYWESLSPAERAQRGVPSRLLPVAEVAEMVHRIAADESLNGRVVVWWSEDPPQLIEWGDRGYRDISVFL